MIYEVTYKDAQGNLLLTATFNANDVKQMLEYMASVPSLQPPAGTADIDIRVMPQS